MENENISYKIREEPKDIIVNIDFIHRNKNLENLIIRFNDQEFIFSREEIIKFFKYIKEYKES